MSEPFADPEWTDAENADESELYFWCEMYSGGRCIKKYKPSVAKLVSKRTGLKTSIVHQQISRQEGDSE